jgi:hypothetical protein
MINMTDVLHRLEGFTEPRMISPLIFSAGIGFVFGRMIGYKAGTFLVFVGVVVYLILSYLMGMRGGQDECQPAEPEPEPEPDPEQAPEQAPVPAQPGRRQNFVATLGQNPNEPPAHNKVVYASPSKRKIIVETQSPSRIVAQYMSKKAFQDDYVRNDQLYHIIGAYNQRPAP